MFTTMIDHFNKKAANYQSFWQKWPFSALRNSESNTILSLLGNIAGKNIAEFGCGSGYYTRLLIQKNVTHIWAIDISLDMLNNLPTGQITPILGDASTIQLNQKFPIIFSAGMLEFTRDPSVVLQNMATHVNPETELILLIPINNLFGKLYELFHKIHGINIHLFALQQFKTMALQANWQIREIIPCGLFSAAIKLTLNN